LAGANLAGTNLGGNNLAGSNLAGSNLAGSNLAGNNLAGANLAGSNLAGSNLAGSNLAGTNLAGNNLAGTNLAGSNLAGSNSGANIHNLSGSTTGMLYSREDTWAPATGRCIVSGIGSTAFAKLLAQQSANAKISVALGKLPWGFATATGGPQTLSAWEATVWGDKTYCTFVLATPPTTAWSGVAGFIKAVFRWQAPTSQAMDISGIEASAPYDPTLSTAIVTYTGMMDTAAKWRAGAVKDFDLLAGELGFVTATTNNQSVMADFASWTNRANDPANPIILGNVQAINPPWFAESVYVTMDNGDGTVGVLVDEPVAVDWNALQQATMSSSAVDLKVAHQAWSLGFAPKPIPRRCLGSMILNKYWAEPIPVGKCDSGIGRPLWGCSSGAKSWATFASTTTTAPMNQYMQVSSYNGGAGYQRTKATTCDTSSLHRVIGETYVHMWEKNYDINRAFVGVPGWSWQPSFKGTVAATGTPCNPTTEGPDKAFDDLSASSNGTKWCVTSAPSTSSPASVMYAWNGLSYAITSYTVISANDSPERDPRDWSLQGCNGSCTVGSDTGWVTLDTQTGQAFTARFEPKTYSFTNSTAYSQIRMRATAAAASGYGYQIGEIQLFDTPAAGVPSDGYTYKVIGQNGKCLNVAGGNAYDGTPMEIQDCNASWGQTFTLYPYGGGQYSLFTASGGWECLEVPGWSTWAGVQFTTRTCNAGANQKFTIRSVGNGFYQVVNVNSGLCVGTSGNGSTSGTSVQQQTCSSATGQRWRFL
jgi:uncharacterized protein YjbI with pentapeptide repeats